MHPIGINDHGSHKTFGHNFIIYVFGSYYGLIGRCDAILLEILYSNGMFVGEYLGKTVANARFSLYTRLSSGA